MITNTQACVASIQTSSKGTNQITEDTLAPIKLLTTRTNDPMKTIQAKGSIQQQSINILLWGKHTTRYESELPSLFRRWRENLWWYLIKRRQYRKMITPTPGVAMNRLQEYTSPLLKWHNVDRWLRTEEKNKRKKGNSKEESHKKSSYPTQDIWSFW